MADKKCCDNCVHGQGRICLLDPNDPIVSQVNPCDSWQRNPDLWLDILPEEEKPREGYIKIQHYFQRHSNKDLMWTVEFVSFVRGETCYFNGIEWKPVSEIGGQWQGPIRPK